MQAVINAVGTENCTDNLVTWQISIKIYSNTVRCKTAIFTLSIFRTSLEMHDGRTDGWILELGNWTD